MSSRTTSTSNREAFRREPSSTTDNRQPTTVIVALGSNLGDRAYHLRRAIHALHDVVRIVRVSTIHETAAVDAPPGSPPFLNMVLAGYTTLGPHALLAELLTIETRLGRAPRRMRNEPRIIDLDLILHGAHRLRTKTLTLPHPRAHARAFVMIPLREIGISSLSSRLRVFA